MRIEFPRRRAVAAAVALAMATATIVHALPNVPDGATFQLLDAEPAYQSRATVAMAGDGRHVVAWREALPGDPHGRLLAQVFTAAGVAIAPPIEVAASTYVFATRVAMSPNGEWMVVWQAQDAEWLDHVYVRRFDAAGQPLGNAYALPGAAAPAVAASINGYHSVVTWEALDAEGAPIVRARPFVIHMPLAEAVDVSVPGEYSSESDVAMGVDDSFVVTWIGWPPGGTAQLFARRFDAMGVAQGAAVAISTPGEYATRARIAGNATGQFVVAWEEQGASAIHVRRLDAAGQPQGGEIVMAKGEPSDRDTAPWVALDDLGAFAVAWSRDGMNGADFSAKTRVARFDANSQLVSEVALDAGTPGLAYAGGIASDADGDLVAVRDWFDSEWDPSRVQATRLLHGTPIDLSVQLDAPAATDHGATFYYSLRVANNHAGGTLPHEGDTAGFAVQIDLPPEATFASAGAIGWECEGNGPLLCSYQAVLTPGESSYPLSLQVQAPAASAQLLATAQLAPRHADDVASNDAASASTSVGDISPDAFDLADLAGVPRGSEQVSNEVTLAGFDGSVVLEITGGSYSLNGGAWSTALANVQAGDRVRVKQQAASSFFAYTFTHLYVGNFNEVFSTQTEARDTSPDAFAFMDATDAPLGLAVTSAPVIVAGINDAAPVTVSGGAWSRNGGAFTAGAGTVNAGDAIRVQHTASLSPQTRTDTTLTVGGVSDIFSSTTLASDTTPDAYSFAPQAGLERGSVATSAEITIGGINSAAPVSVANGSYSINGGAFTATAGTISNGQRVRVRHAASSSFSTPVTSTLTVGGVSAGFTSTTEAADTTPNAFTLADKTGLATNVAVTSDPVTIAGINSAATVSVSGGSWSKNGGAFGAAAGSAVAGDQLRVRLQSASAANTAVHATLTVGGVADTFTGTTGTADSTPNAFAFVDTSAKRNKSVTSAPVAVSGISVPVAISVSGGGAKWSKNGGSFTTAAGTVSNGDQVRLQITTPNSTGSTVNVAVTIGGIADTWSVVVTN